MLFSSAEYPSFLLAVFFMFALLRAGGNTARVARALLFLLLGDLVYLLLAKDVGRLWDPLGGVLFALLTEEELPVRPWLSYLAGAAVFAGAVFLGWRGGEKLGEPRAQARLAVFWALALVGMGALILATHLTGTLFALSGALAETGHLIYLAMFGLGVGAALSPRGRLVGRLYVIFSVSAIFYHAWAAGMWGGYQYLLLLIVGTIVLDYYLALWIHRTEEPGARKALLILSLVSNLGVLALFKYFDFFIGSAKTAAGWAGYDVTLKPFALILPAGISFHTFQSLSYTLDVYRKQLTPTKSVLEFASFVLFFPQLVAGPIVRAHEFMPQLQREPKSGREWEAEAADGLFRILVGLFKKIALADNLARLHVDRVFLDPALFSGVEVLLAVYGYALQIYLDFSAYSDIAIGSAKLLGYEFPENFRTPYRSANLQDFWRRWHITLSSWLRDYLYIPLGGSKSHTYRNLAITMLLGGLWHGGSWNFVIWGGLHGGGLGITRVFQRMREKSPARANRTMVITILASGAAFGLHLLLAGPIGELGARTALGAFWTHVTLGWLVLVPAWAAVTAALTAIAEHPVGGDAPARVREDTPASRWLPTALRFAFLGVSAGLLAAIYEGQRALWLPLACTWLLLAVVADLAEARPERAALLRLALAFAARAGAVVVTFHYVCFAWIFFRAVNLERAELTLLSLKGAATDTVNLSTPFLLTLGVALAAHFFPPGTFRWLRDRFVSLPPPAVAASLIAAAMLLREFASPIIVPFIYFQF